MKSSIRPSLAVKLLVATVTILALVSANDGLSSATAAGDANPASRPTDVSTGPAAETVNRIVIPISINLKPHTQEQSSATATLQATATSVPPMQTATATSVPPTQTTTATSVPPTQTAIATSVPPTPSPSPSTGRTFYVSTLGSNGTGQSWSTAWNELSQINWSTLLPGDNVVIDGGSASMVYRSTLDIQRSGTAAAPIIIRLSTEAGRNGQVNIDGGRTNPLPYWGQSGYVLGGNPFNNGIYVRSGMSWVTVDGSKWQGIAIHGTADSGITFQSNTIHHVVMRNMEVYDTGSSIQSTGGDSQTPASGLWYSDRPGVMPNGDTLLFENIRVHDNGEDAFQVGSGGVTNMTIRRAWLFNARFKPNGTVFNSERHQDGVQIYSGSNHDLLIDRSVLGPNLMQPLILGDGQTVVNNVTVSDTLAYGNTNALMDGASTTHVTGWKITNSTVDMGSSGRGSFDIGYNSTSDNRISITNTIVTGTGGQFLSVPTGGAFNGNVSFYVSGSGDSIPGGTTISSQPYANSVIGSRSMTASYQLGSSSTTVGKGAAITSSTMLGR